MISVGLIGVGKIAKTFHLPAWEQVDRARVLALVDPRLDAVSYTHLTLPTNREV